MKIEGNGHIDSQLQAQKGERKSEQESGKLYQIQRPEDRLEFSTDSRELQLYKEKLSQVPDVRIEKVEEISRQLEAGTYNIKAEKVADGIIKGDLIDELI